MRLAYDVTALYSARTGVGVFTEEVLARLAARSGIDVTAYAVTWRGRGRLPALVPPGVRTARGPMAAQPLRRLWRRGDWPTIEWWTGPAEVVHGPNFVVPPTRRAGRLATVHDLTPVHFPDLSTADTLQYPQLIRRALESGAHLHAVSRFVATEVIDVFGADPERVHVVANGVSTSVEGCDAVRGRELAGGPRYVRALGAVEPRKDLPGLVRAFDAAAADDDDLRLVVAGPDGWDRGAFTAAVEAARHRTRLVRHGWVGGKARADLLAGASVFAYPSRYDGFGLPPLEAMAAGVPVVTTTAGALPETVGDAAVLVAPGDSDALAGALSRVLADEGLRTVLVERGRARARGFSWEACADGLVAVYERLCDN
ncbi:glycosyltransferase family 1 protein [soil metagenome]